MKRRSLRILFIAPLIHDSPKYGGMPIACYYQAKHLEELGHRVYTITASGGEITRITHKPYTIHGNTLLDITARYGVITSPKTWLNILLTDKTLVDMFDIIHIHDARDPVSTSFMLRHNLTTPIVIQPHGSLFYGDRLVTLKKTYDTLLAPKIVEKARYWIASTTTERSSIQRLGVSPERIRIVPNGVDLGRIRLEAERKLPSHLRFLESRRLVLYLGRIHVSKHIELLIKAVAYLIREHSDILVILMGQDESEWRRIARLVKQLSLEKHVHYIGFVEESIKYAILKLAKAVALPKFHCTALTVLESIALNKPVVTTYGSDKLPEELERMIIRVSPSPSEMAHALSELLQGKDTRRDDVHMREGVLESFSWKNIASMLENLYLQSVEGVG